MPRYVDPFSSSVNTLDSATIAELTKPSAWDSIKNMAFTPLRLAGLTLDTPGSVIRGLLAGNSRRAFEGIFNPEQRVSGSELLGNAPDKFTWSGLGAEVLTDPLTYLSGGLTKAGQTAARATSLTNKLTALEKFAGPTDELISRLTKETGDALGKLPDKTLLADTFAEQASKGQRALQLTLPFASIGIPIAKMEGLYGGLTKLNTGLDVLKGSKYIKPGLDALGNALVPNYGLDKVGVELKNIKSTLEREAAAKAAAFESHIQEQLTGIAKTHNMTPKEANDKFLNFVELSKVNVNDSPINLLNKKLEAVLTTPDEIKNLSDSYIDFAEKLRLTGNERHLRIPEYGGEVGYVPRYMTPKAEAFVKDLAKKHGIPLSESGDDDLFHVLSRVPGYQEMRKAFRDMTTTEANQYFRTKHKVDFNLFSADAGADMARRIYNQGTDEARRRFTNAWINQYKTGDKTSAVRLSKILAGNPSYMSKFYTGKMADVFSRFREGRYKDKFGNVLSRETEATREEALKTLLPIRKMGNLSWGDFLGKVSKTWTPEQKSKFAEALLEDTGTGAYEWLVKNGLTKGQAYTPDELIAGLVKHLKPYMSLNKRATEPGGILNTDIKYALSRALGTGITIGKKGTVKEALNATNNLFHTTSSYNMPHIKDAGELQGGVPKQTWASSKLIGPNQPGIFWSPDYSGSIAYGPDALRRSPKGTEFAGELSDHVNEIAKKYGFHESTVDWERFLDGNISKEDVLSQYRFSWQPTDEKIKKVSDFLDEIQRTLTPANPVFKGKLSKFLSNEANLKFDLTSTSPSGFDFEHQVKALRDESFRVRDEAFKALNAGNNDLYVKLSDQAQAIRDQIDSILSHTPSKVEFSGPTTFGSPNYVRGLEGVNKGLPVGIYNLEDLLPSHLIGRHEKDLNSYAQFVSMPQVPLHMLKGYIGHGYKNTISDMIRSVLNRHGKGIENGHTIDMLMRRDTSVEHMREWLDRFDKHIKSGGNVTDFIKKELPKADAEEIGMFQAIGNNWRSRKDMEWKMTPDVTYQNLGKRKIGEKEIVFDLPKQASVKQVEKMFKDAGIKEKYLPAEAYKSMSKLLAITKTPEWLQSFTHIVDSVNAVYRGLYTSIVPSYHIRNDMSGKFMNLLAGVSNPKWYVDSVSGLMKMTPEENTYLKSIGVLGRGQASEVLNIVEDAKIAPKSMFTKMMAPGHKIASSVDNMNRYALYLAKKAEGLSDLEAADQVIKYHFDYSDLTKFERQVMRRSVLFYTFMRKNVPLMMESLVSNPKVMMSYARATGKTNVNLLEPWWMGDAFFANEDENGNKRRLTLGLPPADLDKFDPNYRGLTRVFQLLVTQMNPLFSGAVEVGSGRDLFFDRPLEGGLSDRLLGASPLSRLTGIAQRAQDDPATEAIRSLVGLNLRDIPANQGSLNEQYILKTKLKQMVENNKGRVIESVAPKKEADPASVDDIRILNSLMRKLQEADKK